ncbi:VWFA domain-containing protein [Candidatus Magnetomoraceae bacterium gMMP-1]
MVHPIGIDLGTTNSVCCVYRRGQTETIPIENRSTMPSAISVLPDGNILIGMQGKNRAIIYPDQSVTSAKRFIGDGKTKWKILGKEYEPVDVSSLIIKQLKEVATAFLNNEVTDAVITVPAYFNNNQKRHTRMAAEAAGLNVIQLLPEPTAAAISYGLDKEKDQTIMVYDLGGGTFDVSILKIQQNQFKVIAVDGNFNLGGDDFDFLLVDYLFNILKKKINKEISNKEILLARQQLKEVSEKAKKDLSESDTAFVSLPNILGYSLEEEISIDDYNSMISHLVEQTVKKMKAVLKAAKLNKKDVDRVILVGGSTRNRLVKQRVAETIKEPFISDRVDEVVSQGAAIVAGYLYSPEPDMLPIEFINVTPFDLGVRVSKGSDLDYFDVLIPKNASIPDKAEKDFTTFQDNQKKVDISVFQGDKKSCSENTFIGGFQLTGIPPAPKGQPKIKVKFKMDSSDLLIVTASCEHLRNTKTLDVNMISCEKEMHDNMPKLDIHFLIDTSGSMNDELEGVKRSCLEFADRIISGGIDCRLGLMDFDLPCNRSKNYNWEIFGPTEPSALKSSISKLEIGRLGGCGCYIGEKNTIPVIKAFADSFPDEKYNKIGILISDEVGNEAKVIPELLAVLKLSQICLHVVGVAGSCHVVLARETGGKFWDIHVLRGRVSFNELLDDIAKEITNLALC